jgi:tRNA(Ile)-lysidine synthase
LRERVAETTHHYCMFAPGQTVGIAVSGGADSVALFHLLKELAPRLGIGLRVLHFNHLLRGAESGADCEFVKDLAAAHGIPFETASADVAQIALKSGENLEQAARDARYGFFREQLSAGEVDRVALGHTLSDQAETVLYRLLRGSGLAGLAGIHPVTADGFVRPLIRIERPEIEQWLRQEGHEWREDSSNRDLRFDRNRIRHKLLPALEREWNPNLTAVLANMAEVARGEEAFWETEIERLVGEVLNRSSANSALVNCNLLNRCSLAQRRRLVRRAIRQAKSNLRQIDFAHVEDVLALAARDTGAGGLDLPGLLVRRSFEWLRLAPTAAWPAASEYRFSIAPPARMPIPGSNLIISLALEPFRTGIPALSGRYNTVGVDVLDWTSVTGSVELRNWSPGDRIQLEGDKRPRKMHELFQSRRIPSWERAGWPVIAKGGQILWLKGFGVAGEYRPSRGTTMVLRIQEEMDT